MSSLHPSTFRMIARIRPGSIRLLLSLFICLFVASACTGSGVEKNNGSFVGTSLPVFGLILQELVGEQTRVETLMSDTQSPHAYHPKPSDIHRMSHVAVVVLGSPDLDGWASGLVDAPSMYLSDLIPAESWIVNGSARNPHFWMDPMIVKSIIPSLSEHLCTFRPDDCGRFKSNGQDFSRSLDSLDVEIRAILAEPGQRALFVTQPFMDYFLKRYNIRVAGTLETVPGNEPPPSHIVDLLNSEHSHDALGIIAHERLPYATARVFERETSLPLVLLDPIGKKTDRSYYDFMIEQARAMNALIVLGR